MEDRFIFEITPQLIFDAVILAINILVMCVFLSYLLFNPVRKVLKKRQDRITNEREEAKQNKEDAISMKAEYEEKLKNVEKEAEIILSEARKKGLSNQERIISEAKEEAAKIVEFAKQEAELEKKKVADEVKQEIIKVATVMANKVVSANIDEKVQEELINDTLREIGDSTWLS